MYNAVIWYLFKAESKVKFNHKALAIAGWNTEWVIELPKIAMINISNKQKIW